MRVVLFGLPFAALLAASSILPMRFGPIAAALPIFPRIRRQRRLLQVAVTVVVLIVGVMTTVVRGGNDAYESFTTGELAAVNYVYDHIKFGQSIGMAVSYLPLGLRDVSSISIDVVSGGTSTPPVGDYQKELVSSKPRWIILSRSQEAWGEIVGGYSRGWLNVVQNGLISHGYTLVAHWPSAEVLKKLGP